MENKVTKKNVLVPILAAIIIVFFHNLNINWYFKNIIIPFSFLIISNIIIYKENKFINKKAYFILIPITLILISDPIIKIDASNKFLNVIVLFILISIFLFLLVNKNYKISVNNISLMFKLFPDKIFSNLKYLKPSITKEKNKKIVNVILGLAIGAGISFVILLLLTSADDYFDAFLDKFSISFNLDISNIILFIIWFIIMFSISINVYKNKDIKMREVRLKKIDNTIIITVLSVINFVFVLFLISEISKLCGNFLQLPKGYIYSSYAREGFFQLLFVTLINFSIISFLMYKTNGIKENKIVRNLIFLLISFSIILIFNSYYRMYLYIDKFGFTVLRLQVMLFLTMEVVLFGVIIKKILSEIKNEGVILLSIMSFFYVLNLYLCNDWFIRLINR